MIRYIKYVSATGEIRAFGWCMVADLPLQSGPGEDVIVTDASGIEWATHYVLDGTVIERPEMSIVQSGLTLSGLPDPATLRIETQTYEVTGGDAELSFSLPGDYVVRVEAWPWKNADIVVTAP